MRATGIVRRVDDLGRMVIPKEVRKTFRIGTGDPLEIFTNGNEIIFKKYKPFAAIEDYANDVASSLYDVFGHIVFITDDDTIVAIEGEKKKALLQHKTKDVLPDFYDKKEEEFETAKKTITINDESREVQGYVCVPIHVKEKVVGSIIVLGKNGAVDTSTLQSVRVQARMFKGQLESTNP